VIPQPPAAVSGDVGRTVRTDTKLPKPPSTAPKPQIIVVQTIPAPADIKLSGIAWQEERVARRVVINGFLMQEGATVSGAKISEIHQDRVRFTSPSGVFDLRMDGATSLPGAPK
jgi:general secretion pathway protein B